ncbi:MAG: PAS domain-containing protein [Magnetococcales bacterium]|nr:CHASE domain-containing protein [Magnetococcales bacterium]NGZ05302.1 PAS domain-containing protein [Magnetococcales bacterium]
MPIPDATFSSKPAPLPSPRLPEPQDFSITLLLTGVVGVLLSLAVFFSVRTQVALQLKQEFEWVAQDRHRAVQKGLESALGAIHEMHDLLLSSPQIQVQAFLRVAALVRTRYPEVEALQWVAWEKLPAPSGNEQAVTTYQEPAHAALFPIGYDHFADHGQRKFLEEARDTGQLTISGRISLAADNPRKRGFLAAQAVYRPGAPLTTVFERHHALMGFVIGIFRFENLAEEAIALLEPRGVECMILDDQAAEEERFLHFYTSRLTSSPYTFQHAYEWQLWMSHPDPKLTAHTRLGNRNWSITCSQTPQFRSAEWFTRGHWAALGVGLLLTALLTHHLWRIRRELAIRTRMAAQMAESERLLSVLFHRSPDIIRLINQQGRELLVNRTPAAGEESDPTDPTTPASPEFQLEYQQALKQAFTQQIAVHLHHRAKSDLWWEIRIVPLHEETGTPAAMVVATDISENKMLEEQAGKNARLASLGLMAAGVAHEINNPNNSIYYNATLLDEAWKTVKPILDEYWRENGDFAISGLSYAEMGEKIPQIIGWIIDNTERIKKIVELLKSLVRDEAQPGKIPIFWHQVAQGTLLLLNNTIQKHTERFSARIPADLPPVLGHPQQLEQVLINVIVNALQALPDRSHGVQLEAALDESGREVILIVRDEGKGIHPTHLEKITEPFFTTRLEKGGTGLGLSISATIIKNLGGRLRFESVLNHGTSVFIHLPCAGDA